MKLRIARLGVLLAAVIGLMATMVPSASANTIKTITFTGNADLDRGLGYACTPSNLDQCPPDEVPQTKTGPKNEPQANVAVQGNHANFNFISGACVKTSVSSPNKPNQKNGAADLCVLTASGTVWGFCGLSTGVGVATLINPAKNPSRIDTSFKFTGIGGVLHVSGGNKDTNIYAEVTAVPNPSVGGPSCTNKTATTFILTGEATYKDCTKGTTAGVCNV